MLAVLIAPREGICSFVIPNPSATSSRVGGSGTARRVASSKESPASTDEREIKEWFAHRQGRVGLEGTANYRGRHGLTVLMTS